MKTITALCALAALATLSAVAAADSPRSVTIEYQGANTIEGSGAGVYISNIPEEVKPRPDERFIAVEVSDESGRPVLAAVHQRDRELGGEFCDQTPRPRRLVTRKAVHVHLYVGEGCDGVSLPTQGTVKLTFFRR